MIEKARLLKLLEESPDDPEVLKEIFYFEKRTGEFIVPRRFKPGDLVQICKQPKNQFAHVLGERGFIEEIEPWPYYRFRAIASNGTNRGGGSIPEDNLKALGEAYLNKSLRAKWAAEEDAERRALTLMFPNGLPWWRE